MAQHERPLYSEKFSELVPIEANTTTREAVDDTAKYLYFTRYFDAGYNEPITIKFYYY